ncbi:hypothetical protein BDZ89DRAFT_1084095 [Hymenopellis radicata]|nr:hypothetical protein BDZ89DRAFT_1084095 [Hymenopellis radicata]
MSPTAVEKDTTLALSLIHLHELFDDYFRDPALRGNRALLPSPDVIFNFCVQHRLIEAPFLRVYRHLHDQYRSISGARDVIEKWCAGQTTANTTSPIDTYRKPAARRRPKLLFGESRGERRPKSKPRQRVRKTSTRSSAASAITPSAPASMSNQSSLLFAEPTQEHPFTSSKLAEDGKIVVTGDSAKEFDCPAKDAASLARKTTSQELIEEEQSEEVASVVQGSKKDTC